MYANCFIKISFLSNMSLVMDTQTEKEQLSQLYYTPAQAASFGGVQQLIDQSKLQKTIINEWLPYQFTYTLHEPARHNYARNRTLVSGIDDQWQADHVDMSTYKQFNQGFRYLLTIIDIFSKFAWVLPLKTKTDDDLVAALQHVFAGDHQPIKVNMDQGTEFENKKLQTFLKRSNVHYISTRSDKKAAVVEHFNRTLKIKM